jgi:hypothetical protein
MGQRIDNILSGGGGGGEDNIGGIQSMLSGLRGVNQDYELVRQIQQKAA